MLVLFIFCQVVWANQDARSIKRKTATRTALVIGNSNYKSAPLKNPVNDAKDIAAVLKSNGFKVTLKLDATKKDMKESVKVFGKQLLNGGVGLFYYAGHGIQLKDRNYLIPVNADITSESDVEYESLDAGRILGKMEDAGNGMNIVILDACRNNPFARSFRSSTQGLARMDAPTGSLIAYATAPGSVAADGQGNNGIYTKHLLENMRMPGLKLEDVLKNVRVAVLNETNNKQTPWEASSLTIDFYFAQDSFAITRPINQSTTEHNKGKLSITSNIEGADIFLENRFNGITPLEIISIDPGSYKIKARLKGFDTIEKTISVNQNRKAVITFYFEQKETKGRLYLSTEPADCTINLLNAKTSYTEGIALDPGHYKIEVSKPGFISKTETITILLGEGLDLYVALEKDQGGNIAKIEEHYYKETETIDGALAYLRRFPTGRYAKVLKDKKYYLKVKNINTNNSDWDHEITYQYNKNGLCISERTQFINIDQSSVTTHRYDQSGNRIESTEKHSPDNRSDTTIFKYNGKHLLVSSSSLSPGWQLESKYEYDDLDQKIKEYHSYDGKQSIYTTEYNEDGQPIHFTMVDYDGNQTKTTYYYNQGHLDRYESVGDTYNSKSYHIYDSVGKLVKLYHIINGKRTDYMNYFDAYGNTTKVVVSGGNNLTMVSQFREFRIPK